MLCLNANLKGKRVLLLVAIIIFWQQKALYCRVNQQSPDSILSGSVINTQNQPLPYTTIYLPSQQTGTISNEEGYFSLNIATLSLTDTIRFHYVGYQEKAITLEQLKEAPQITLQEKVSQLSELTVFGLPPDPETVIKKVLENAPSNYGKAPFQKRIFVRNRNAETIKTLKIDHKKSSLSEVDLNLMKEIEKKVPKYMTWYTDFLGNAYRNLDGDEATFKALPERVVSLKQEDFTELEHIEKVFTNLAENTKEEEYWKVKTGILSSKIDYDVTDSSTAPDPDQRKLSYFVSELQNHFSFTTFENEDDWEFLHQPRYYKFSIIGGSQFKGEQVYIIDFEPKRKGTFQGRVYISTDTYALLRADFHYAPGKVGRDIDLFGVSYTQKGFEASITFEKHNNTYQLAYFSKRETQAYSVNRKFSLIKKRERFLWDKELEEVKVDLVLSMEDESSVEVCVMSHDELTPDRFEEIEQPEYMRVIYVDQFDDQLWNGYSIIEPTQQMRTYKKRSTP